MAVISGTPGNDVITGTIDADVIDGGIGNDRINGGAGNDTIYGQAGNDTLTGDAGNDTLFGGEGDDGFYGGGNDDIIYGEAGNDTMFGDAGNDWLDGGAGTNGLNGGTGNDTLVHRVGLGVDTIVGGSGTDTLRLEIDSAQLTSAVRADLATLNSWMSSQLAAAGGNLATLAAQTSGATLSLNALGVTVSTFEQVAVVVDGKTVPLASLLNVAPVADATASIQTAEDTAVAGQVSATDADGDALSFSLSQGPAHGKVSLDAATGHYTYTPSADYSGTDQFVVRFADPSGASAMQTIDVSVAGVADAPALAAADLMVGVAQSLTGTAGNDTLQGGAGDDRISGGDGNDLISGDGGSFARTFGLDIAAALADVDGSEALSIRVAGLPADAVLSAGAANGDGSWTLMPGDLAGLELATATTAGFSLAIEATAREANGSASTTSATLAVSFDVGNGGDDRLDDGAGDDKAYGGAGYDLFIVGAGNDVYDGGQGVDTADLSSATAAVTVDLSKGTATGMGTDKLVSVENVVGSRWADTITGNKLDNALSGGDGNDVLNGGDGNDRLDGGADADMLSGGTGDDVLDGGDGIDKLYGNSGNDILRDGAGDDFVRGGLGNDRIIAGAGGNDRYEGSSGYDTLDFSGATHALAIDTSAKKVTGEGSDTISGFELIIGSALGDSYKGSSRAEAFDGGAGDDVIRSLGGADVLTGGEGSDTFVYFKKDVVSGTTHLGVDTITDLQVGDRIDIADMLKDAKYGSIDDVVHLTTSADGAMLSVKLGSAFVDVALLRGYHEDSASDMLANGMLLV